MINWNSKIRIRKCEVTYQDNYYCKYKNKYLSYVFLKIFKMNLIAVSKLSI